MPRATRRSGRFARCVAIVALGASCIAHAAEPAADEGQRLNQRAQTLLNIGERSREQSQELERTLDAMLELAIDRFGNEHPSVAFVRVMQGGVAAQERNYAKAIGLFRQAQSTFEASTQGQAQIPRVLFLVSEAQRQAGRPLEAVAELQRGIALADRLAEKEGEDLAEALMTLGDILLELDRPAEALPAYARSLEISEANKGTDDPLIALRLLDMVRALVALGRVTEAVPLAERSVTIRERALGPDDPAVGIALGDLGSALLWDGRHAQAAAALERSIGVLRKSAGARAQDLAIPLDTLANLELGLGHFPRAQALAEEALAIRRAVFGEMHADVGASLHTLGLILSARGDADGALALQRRSLTIFEQVLPAQDARIATSLTTMADTLVVMARPAEALQLQQRALALREAAVGPHSTALVSPLLFAADMYGETGRFDDGIALAQRALAIGENAKGQFDTAPALAKLAGLRGKQGRYDEAVELARRAIAVQEPRGESGAARLASYSRLLGGLYVSTARYSQAIPILERSLSATEAFGGPTHPDVADALDTLAAAYKGTGRYTDALSLLRRSLSIREAAFQPTYPKVAYSLIGLAAVLLNVDRPAEARPLQERGLSILESSFGVDDPRVARALEGLGLTYERVGLVDDANRVMERALSIVERALGPAHPDAAESQMALASFLVSVARYDEAEILVRKALRIRANSFGEANASTAHSVHQLAFVRLSAGHTAEPLALFEKAQNTWEITLGQDHPFVAYALTGRAAAFTTLGAFDRARPLVERAADIRARAFGEHSWQAASGLCNLASLDLLTGKVDSATKLVDRAMAIAQSTGAPDVADFAAAQYLQGEIYVMAGRYDEAVPIIRRGLAAESAAFGEARREYIIGLVTLGQALRFAKDMQQSREVLEHAHELSLNQPRSSIVHAHVLRQLANWHEESGDAELAIFFGKAAVNALQDVRIGQSDLNAELRQSFVALNGEAYRDLVARLIARERYSEARLVIQMLKESELHQSVERTGAGDARTTRIEFSGLERDKAQAYYGLMEQQAQLVRRRQALEAQRRLEPLTPQAQIELAEVLRQQAVLRAGVARIVAALAEELAAQRKSGQHILQVREGGTRLGLTIEALHRTEPAGGAVGLQYYLSDGNLTIFVVPPGGPPIVRQVAIARRDLVDLAFSFVSQVSTRSSVRDRYLESARRLHDLLIHPVLQDLRTLDARTLVLSLNGVLRYLPFAALHDGQRFLVQEFAIVGFNDAAGQVDFAQRPARLKVAGMALTSAVDGLPALSAAGREARQVVAAAQGTAYLDTEFNLSRLVSVLDADFNVLHLATHYVFIPGRADLSMLYLGDKSRLSLVDIAGQQFHFGGLDLLTLSACETAFGGGQDAFGIELESFAALAQTQGARAIAATLWRVDDPVSATLMEAFYIGRVRRGLNKAEALRAAQRTVLEAAPSNGAADLSHPYYWAPFVLMGNWR